MIVMSLAKEKVISSHLSHLKIKNGEATAQIIELCNNTIPPPYPIHGMGVVEWLVVWQCQQKTVITHKTVRLGYLVL